MQDLIQKNILKAFRFGRLFAKMPFVRSVILNGSLAQGKAKKNSDIDLLIITADSRLWTARFFVMIVVMLSGQKRSKNGGNHAAKLCINYFLTESYLKIGIAPGREEYCAKNYARSIFVAGNMKLYEKFLNANSDLFKKYGSKIINNKKERRQKFSASRFLQMFMELLLGNWFEMVVKKLQIKKIESDPRTELYPKHIVFSGQEARFHPPKDKKI